jgi:hypothetical protein
MLQCCDVSTGLTNRNLSASLDGLKGNEVGLCTMKRLAIYTEESLLSDDCCHGAACHGMVHPLCNVVHAKTTTDGAASNGIYRGADLEIVMAKLKGTEKHSNKPDSQQQ